MKIPKPILISALIIAGLIIAIIIFNLSNSKEAGGEKSGEKDNFAQCLTDNSVKMYGAFWCSHCEAQKEMFGQSFKNINYIECSLPDKSGQTLACQQAQIRAYPTWEFKDEKRIEGALSFTELSQNSGCEFKEL